MKRKLYLSKKFNIVISKKVNKRSMLFGKKKLKCLIKKNYRRKWMASKYVYDPADIAFLYTF